MLEPDEFLCEEDFQLICSRLFNAKFYELGKIGRLSLNKRLGLNFLGDTPTITAHDIFAILDYFLSVKSFLPDDIDDLRNRRVRSVGELLENQFRIGLNRLERNIIERIRIWRDWLTKKHSKRTKGWMQRWRDLATRASRNNDE